jgi:hypothetical protein
MFNSDQDRLSDLEQRLRSWVPSAGGLDRDRMLFEAGQAAAGAAERARMMSRWWKFAAGAAAVLALSLGVAWRNERRERLALQLDIARSSQPALLTAPVASRSVLMAQRHVKAVAPDRWSYLTLVRQVSRIEQGESLEPPSTEPTTKEKVEPTRSLRNAPLTPRDFERVIAL